MRINFSLFLIIAFIKINGAHTIQLSKPSFSLTIDNLSDLGTDRTIFGITTVQIVSDFQALGGGDPNWDLYLSQTLTDNDYSSDGTAFSAAQLKLRATNQCESAAAHPGISFAYTGLADRITNSFGSIPLASNPYYIIGSETADVNNFTTNCPSPANPFNSDGSYLTTPETHSIRIDAQLDFTEFHTGGRTIRPGKYIFNLSFVLERDNVGFIASAPFTLELEILPVLQLNLLSSDQIDFDFSDISNYQVGITKMARTILEVSSNVNWDLYPVGTSVKNESSTGQYYWDSYAQYTSSGTADIPLSALQIHQLPGNPVLRRDPAAPDVLDYSNNFVTQMTVDDTNNNILVSRGFLPLTTEPIFGNCIFRAIAGSIDKSGTDTRRVGPGSYFIPSSVWLKEDYRFIISYRIVPGVPSAFIGSNPSGAIGSNFGNAGNYTMQIRYILKADQ